jgi:hypothetical protein
MLHLRLDHLRPLAILAGMVVHMGVVTVSGDGVVVVVEVWEGGALSSMLVIASAKNQAS